MKTAVAVGSFAALLQLAAAEGALQPRQSSGGTPIINTPSSLVTCEPAAITYSGGTPPYFISVFPAGQTSNALQQFPQQSAAGSFTWTVNLAAGTQVTLGVRDGAGQTNFAQQVTIENGTSTSCVGGAVSISGASGGATGSAPSTGGSGPTSSGSGSSAPASTGSSSSGGSKSSSGSQPAATTGSGSGSGAMGVKATASTVALALLGVAAYLF